MLRLAAGFVALTLAARCFAGEPVAVRVEVFGRDIPQVNRLPDAMPEPTETLAAPAFALAELPWAYTSTGVRADRPAVFVVRATSEIPLPAGKLRLLLRARSAARLLIDGKLVAALPFAIPFEDGPLAVRHGVPTHGRTRQVAPGDREKIVEYSSDGRTRRVVLELLVGGVRNKKDPLRPELGEALVAVAPVGSDEFRLLAPGRPIPLTDAEWERYALAQRAANRVVEAKRRAEAFAPHAAHWHGRHEAARRFVRERPAPAVPAPSPGLAANNAIDHFLNVGIAKALAASKAGGGAIDFYRDIRPILQAKCVNCHGASKPKGGYRIDERATALTAVTPGKPGESELYKRITSTDANERMPPKGDRLSKREASLMETWIRSGAAWPDEPAAFVSEVSPLTANGPFLRRVSLDLIGTAPTADEAAAFLASADPDKRAKRIDRLLADPRWADAWVPYWQDALAENPNIVNPTLNNTGPFRYWLHEALSDNRPWDRVVTELVMMEGSPLGGGPAGFGLAAQNDAPMAAKAGLLATAFLATEMKCARCHDAPYQTSTQADLFRLAAMLSRKPVKIPATSSVPPDKLGRKPLITVSLSPGDSVAPAWSLGRLLAEERVAGGDGDTRARLAALFTAPENERFAEVMVNRVWRRYFGRGLVEPPHDWDRAKPSHPELLRYLAREFVASGYDLKQVSRLILNSRAYQRESSASADAVRVFAAPARRRLGPEVFVDSLFDAFGRAYDTGPITFDLDGSREWKQGFNYGVPRRAWEFPYLSNDRDRPSLALPAAQAVTDLLTAFGWDGNRQFAVSDRAADASVLQPALLANGVAAGWLTRLSDDSALTTDCLAAKSPAELTDRLYLRILTRAPSPKERTAAVAALTPGFADRILPPNPTARLAKLRHPYASWAQHHTDDSMVIKAAETAAARRGPPPTDRLAADWRGRAEDVLWALLNNPELVYFP